MAEWGRTWIAATFAVGPGLRRNIGSLPLQSRLFPTMRFRLLLATFVLSACLSVTSRAAERPPNIILILADDLGATDLGCTGSKFYETPNIDRLAREGMRFTTAYSACTVCSPSRASLLTGRSPAALRVTDWIAGHRRPAAKLLVPDWTKELRSDEVTLAELLKKRGYATASIGKWHLGANGPETHGFDVNIAGTERGQPPSYIAPYMIPTSVSYTHLTLPTTERV